MTQKTYTLGDTVNYFDTRGRQKMAFITGTPESIDPEGEIPRPQVGYAHLLVFSPSGQVYAKASVPLKALAEGIEDYTIDGVLGGYFDLRS